MYMYVRCAQARLVHAINRVRPLRVGWKGQRRDDEGTTGYPDDPRPLKPLFRPFGFSQNALAAEAPRAAFRRDKRGGGGARFFFYLFSFYRHAATGPRPNASNRRAGRTRTAVDATAGEKIVRLLRCDVAPRVFRSRRPAAVTTPHVYRSAAISRWNVRRSHENRVCRRIPSRSFRPGS